MRLPQTIGPLEHLFEAIFAAVKSPNLLTSLRLTGLGLDCRRVGAALQDTFHRLGPHLRSLYFAGCTEATLPWLCEAYTRQRWTLERLEVREMDSDDLLAFLGLRSTLLHPRLKVLSLEPYLVRPPPREKLARFAEVVHILV
jgi:hypothetical protein